jgi:hypothetical protein
MIVRNTRLYDPYNPHFEDLAAERRLDDYGITTTGMPGLSDLLLLSRAARDTVVEHLAEIGCRGQTTVRVGHPSHRDR